MPLSSTEILPHQAGRLAARAVHVARVDGEARCRQGGRDGQQLLQLQPSCSRRRLQLLRPVALAGSQFAARCEGCRPWS